MKAHLPIKMNILVTGAKGQLGSEIQVESDAYKEYNFFFEDSKSLDITQSEIIKNYITEHNISVVINCAAYTAVDKAESEIEKAEAVNVLGVKNILLALVKVKNSKLIHISTDYVFNGTNHIPYKETDDVDPIGIYGKTKRVGEELILNSMIDGIIIRTSWVYSSFGNNFVKTMMRLGEERENLNVIFDQIGSPTYAKDLANLCLFLLDKDFQNRSKIYHYSNEGVLSWYDFAKCIMELANIDCEINPIETKDYPTPAKRPNYSLLNKSRIKEDFDIEIPYWKDSLKECIKIIQN